MTPFRRLLVTGGAGFIGSNFIRHMLDGDRAVRITNLDKLTYAGNLENLRDVEADPRYTFVRGDIGDPCLVEQVFQRAWPDAVVNFAAESHVDRSVLGSTPFVDANVRGTLVLLEAVKAHWADSCNAHRFVQISTDEVYGDLGPSGCFTEQSLLAPNNPYAATKASADLICRAYHRTHGVPIVITRCSNNYGPYQFPEKLVPLMIHKASRMESLPVYGDGSNVRDWIHVADHCRAIETVLHHGANGEIYNVGAGNELTNIELIRQILHLLGQPEDLIEFVRDRPGHDRRYAIDATKIGQLGWQSAVLFEQGLADTVQWYVSNSSWVKRCVSGEYREYYAHNYQDRGAAIRNQKTAGREHALRDKAGQSRGKPRTGQGE